MQSNPFFYLTTIIQLDSEDSASWIRTRIIEIPFKFVTNPTNDREKKINKHLKTEMKGLGPQFMLILLEYYQKYIKEGLNPTPEVMQATNEVRDENDLYIAFIDDLIEKTKNDFDRISQPDINRSCSRWFSENKINNFKKSLIKEAMEKKYGGLIKNLWIDNKDSAGWSFLKWKNSL